MLASDQWLSELIVGGLFAGLLAGCAFQGRRSLSEEQELFRENRRVPLIRLTVGSIIAADVTAAISTLMMA
jgi:hypothetical protein